MSDLLNTEAPSSGRALGIDYGDRRVGVSVSDENQMIARALETVHRVRGDDARLYRAIAELIRAHEVVHVVVGWPLRLNGREGIQTQKVARFIEALAPYLDVEISRWDERLTTTSAERALREAGLKGTRQRAKVDQVAAAVILQSWLDARAQRRAQADH